jgi:hypothetical protein
MTDGPQYFTELVDDIDQKAQDAIEEIVDKANWVADKLEGAAGSLLEGLGHLIPGESDVEKAIDKWNNEIQPAIQEQVWKLAQEVADAVGKLAGEPLTLIAHSEKMIAAKATLYRQSTLKQDITNLGNTWEGAAYKSYATSSPGPAPTGSSSSGWTSTPTSTPSRPTRSASSGASRTSASSSVPRSRRSWTRSRWCGPR